MINRKWRFHVKEGKEIEFLGMNRRDWPKFFEGSPDYGGTEVERVGEPRVYETRDRWDSEAAFRNYVGDHQVEFDTLCVKHAKLYDKSENLGFVDE